VTAPTAPEMPRCPVCGKEPRFIGATKYLPAKIICYGNGDDGWLSHELIICGPTDEEADARWRRLAGAGGEGK